MGGERVNKNVFLITMFPLQKHKKERRRRHSSRASEHDDGPNLLVATVEDEPEEDSAKTTPAKPPNTLNTQPEQEKNVSSQKSHQLDQEGNHHSA